ncbi:MAG: pantoate--beta-alanine ligase [Salinarimonadaceae bacterium]|nr:MAG: pantoate--beta-alanine ligase [Salinarimonadaceae bacterium]
MNGLQHARRGIDVAETIADLRAQVASWRVAGERVALVPTMGALHEGHLSLVRLARANAERVIVSIFVNPTQFAPTEDLEKYPRTFDADCAALDRLADLVFAPAAQVMYAPGECTFIEVDGPARAGLEDLFRPTHFRGVATIVAKLLIVAAPDFATFGEKDYQQLKVVTRMARDLFLPVTILPGATVREADGLALSSRNRYLTAQERAIAPTLHAALDKCAAALRKGVDAQGALDAARAQVAQAGFRIDYLALRDAETLGEPHDDARRRLLVAAHLGATRLIDNIPVED